MLLSSEEQEHVRKNLKRFISKYEEADRAAKEKRERAREEKRNAKLKAWRDAGARRHSRFLEHERMRRQLGLSVENSEDYDIKEEDVETVLSSQSEVIA